MNKANQVKFANWEIATYSLHLLDGITKRVHTEDIALKCYQIASDSFSWIKYPQYPDKDVVRSALVDARKEKNGVLVEGRAGRGSGHTARTKAEPELDGWMLTEAGIKWVRENEERLIRTLGQREQSTHRQERLRQIARITSHRLFQEFATNQGDFSPSIGDLAELFRCRVDADKEIWEKRFAIAEKLAQSLNGDLVLKFLKACRTSLGTEVKPS